MISIVCVYNDKEVLDKYLLKSLTTQSVEYELILVENIKENFKSASEALNHGANKAKGDYLMFVHQDVDLKSNRWLEYIEKAMNTLNNCGIAGVAGIPENEFKIKSNIENGIPPTSVGEKIKVPTKVQTVDECLVIIPKSVFKEFKFDEKLGGWHLYAVDYSLNIQKYGFNVYVLPTYVYHRSYMLHYPKEYYQTLKLLYKKYKDDYKMIHSCCGVWNTSYPIRWYLFLNTRIGYPIKAFIDYYRIKFK
jgi:hypothetical protein